jgi:hypothetical protein
VNGSLPAGPALRRLSAEWAQIDYSALRDLIERDEETRSSAPVKARSAAARKKKAAPRLVRVHS